MLLSPTLWLDLYVYLHRILFIVTLWITMDWRTHSFNVSPLTPWHLRATAWKLCVHYFLAACIKCDVGDKNAPETYSILSTHNSSLGYAIDYHCFLCCAMVAGCFPVSIIIRTQFNQFYLSSVLCWCREKTQRKSVSVWIGRKRSVCVTHLVLFPPVSFVNHPVGGGLVDLWLTANFISNKWKCTIWLRWLL